MTLFEMSRNDKNKDLEVAKKSNSTIKSVVSSTKGNLLASINNAKLIVDEKLGHLKNQYVIIRTEQELNDYIDKCIENNVVAIDTETTGLDAISDKIVGLCLYTPYEKAAYVPINHISYITNERVEHQIEDKSVGQILNKLNSHSVKIIMFNASFDIRVLRNQCNVYLTCYWDALLAARCLNENEPSNALKKLHQKYVLNDAEDEFSFGELFKGITFDKVPIDTAYIYAAHDAIITYELYKFQKQYLYYDPVCLPSDRNGMNGVSWVFFNIEMPLVKIVCDMEDIGVDIDLDYSEQLSKKYNALLEEKTNAFYNELDKYSDLIEDYKKSHKDSKIDDKLNIASSTQIAILLYDILKIQTVDAKTPRGTGEAILKKIDLPITNAILEYREVAKLISTYIDKLPKALNTKDNRIHCRFNQYGADTGRFSSSDPNLQNIPSHNKDIRKMFKATSDTNLICSEYNQTSQYFKVSKWCSVETISGMVSASQVKVGDVLKVLNDDDIYEDIIVTKIEVLIDSNQIIFYY